MFWLNATIPRLASRASPNDGAGGGACDWATRVSFLADSQPKGAIDTRYLFRMRCTMSIARQREKGVLTREAACANPAVAAAAAAIAHSSEGHSWRVGRC